MSLDVTLVDEAGAELFSANITHNLGEMADQAGIYAALWRPATVGITKAGQLVEPMLSGIGKMVADRTRFEAFNATNSWGRWSQFVPWCQEYLRACQTYPEANVIAEP